MSRLYEITSEYRELIELIENGDIPEEAIDDTLEGIVGEFEAKIDNIACIVKNMRSLCEDIKAEVNTLMKRKQAKEREIERLEAYISRAMEAMGKASVETARNKLSFRRSEGLRVTDEEALLKWAKENAPDAVSVSEKVSTAAIKELARTTNVPFAVIETRRNLQIK